MADRGGAQPVTEASPRLRGLDTKCAARAGSETPEKAPRRSHISMNYFWIKKPPASRLSSVFSEIVCVTLMFTLSLSARRQAAARRWTASHPAGSCVRWKHCSQGLHAPRFEQPDILPLGTFGRQHCLSSSGLATEDREIIRALSLSGRSR